MKALIEKYGQGLLALLIGFFPEAFSTVGLILKTLILTHWSVISIIIIIILLIWILILKTNQDDPSA